MFNNSVKGKLFLLGILVSIFFLVPFASHVFASETNGTIDATSKYAWGENVGWLNFGCDGCNVQITDSGLSGNAWSNQFGWINLNPSTSGIKNNPAGKLSGYAWSSNLGWINFADVSINEIGEFSGYATIKSDNSRINFNCAGTINSCSTAEFKVKTDWRPANVRHHGGGGGGGNYGCKDRAAINYDPFSVSNPALCQYPNVLPPIINPIVSTIGNIGETINSAADFFLNFFRPKNQPVKVIVQIPKITPFSFSGLWNLLPVEAIRSFVFAPLPYEIRILASKFPELSNTLRSVGVTRFTDISKLVGANLNIPGLADELNKTINNLGVNNLNQLNNLNGIGLNIPGFSNINKIITNPSVGTGKIALINGLPIAKFSLTAKNNLPSEFVFARAAGELVDLNIAMSVGNTGTVTQQISSILPGEKMRLVVKPISKPRSVTGYFVFKSATPRITINNQNEILRSSLTASALFSMNDLVQNVATPIPVENKLVLSTFEYTDPDHDGIYTADVISPSVPGEYEVITIIDYIDPVLGTRRMSMIAVVDPEGYVFEKNNGKETRIPSAIVSLYYLNTLTKKYELWPAKDYQQENPQVTDVRGTYSFLVPQGSYYFAIEAPGYDPYQGKVFVVVEGSGIHQNIELNSGQSWFSQFDWKTILLIVVFLLLVYNLVRSRARDRVASP